MKATKKFDILPRTIMTCGSGKKITPTLFTAIFGVVKQRSKTELRGTLRLHTCLCATLETIKGLEIQINRQIATRSR